MPVNCKSLTEEKIEEILSTVLYEFPIKEIHLDFPHWISRLDSDHEIRKSIFSAVSDDASKLSRIKDVRGFVSSLKEKECVSDCRTDEIDLSVGCIRIVLSVPENLFYKVLSEKTGTEISDEQRMRILDADEKKYAVDTALKFVSIPPVPPHLP